jgi:4-amino-4-deoxy-L-arabinose transferase-like glycosyltransferase
MWHSIPMNKYASNYGLLISKIPNNALPFIRFVIFIFAFLSVLLFYIFVRSFYGMLPAIVSTSLLITNFIFIELSTQILADPVLLFFFIFFVLLCALYLKSGNNIFIFFCFVLSSFAFLTKLNGLILIFVLFFVILVKNRFHISNYNFKILIFGFITFLLMTILLNPFFINSGIHGIVKMVEHRVSHIHFQQETFKSGALPSMGERFQAEIGTIFFKFSLLNKLIGFPFELILFFLGVYYSFRKRDLILLIILVFFILPTISILPLHWKRYYYTVIPFIYIIAGVSLNIFKELKKGDKKYKFY